MPKGYGVITGLLILIFGAWLAIPGNIGLSTLTIKAMNYLGCFSENVQASGSCKSAQSFDSLIYLLQIVGAIVVVCDLFYLLNQFRKGSYV